MAMGYSKVSCGTDLKSMICELIQELERMDVDTLEEFRTEWIEEMEHMGVHERAKGFCIKAIDLVLQKKIEKPGMTREGVA